MKWLELPLHHPKDWDDPRFRQNMSKVDWDDLFWISVPKLIEPADITYPVAGYCTARNCHNWIIKKWLRVNGFPDAEVINVGFHGNKVDVLKDKCDVMVDDSMSNYIKLNESGILCYLMSRPHNEKESVGRWRVNDIHEFMKKIHTMNEFLNEDSVLSR